MAVNIRQHDHRTMDRPPPDKLCRSLKTQRAQNKAGRWGVYVVGWCARPRGHTGAHASREAGSWSHDGDAI